MKAKRPRGRPRKIASRPVKPPVEPPRETASTDSVKQPPAGDDIRESQRKKAQLEVRIKEIELARIERNLIPKDLVEALKRTASIAFRDTWFAMIDRTAAELAAITDPVMVRNYLHEHYTPLIQAIEEGWIPPEYDNEAVA